MDTTNQGAHSINQDGSPVDEADVTANSGGVSQIGANAATTAGGTGDFIAPHPGQQPEGQYQAPFSDKPVEAEEETRNNNLYPPDIYPAVEIGGGPAEEAGLAEEYVHGSRQSQVEHTNFMDPAADPEA